MKEKLRVSLLSWGREAVEAQGRLRTAPGSPVPPHCPQAPSLSPATRAWALGGAGAAGLAEGQGETLGPFPTLGEALAGGEDRA